MLNTNPSFLENPIDPELIKKYKAAMELVDSYESYSSIAKISYFRNRKHECKYYFRIF
jgi:hypothetical protein